MQPPITASSRFTIRADFPDVDPAVPTETLATVDLAGLAGRLASLSGQLDSLTVGEAPLMIEVRRLS